MIRGQVTQRERKRQYLQFEVESRFADWKQAQQERAECDRIVKIAKNMYIEARNRLDAFEREDESV